MVPPLKRFSFRLHSSWGACWTFVFTLSVNRRPLKSSSPRCWWKSSATRYQRWSRALHTPSTFIKNDRMLSRGKSEGSNERTPSPQNRTRASPLCTKQGVTRGMVESHMRLESSRETKSDLCSWSSENSNFMWQCIPYPQRQCWQCSIWIWSHILW